MHQAPAKKEPESLECLCCRKTFRSTNAHASHMRSKKHKKIAAKAEAKSASSANGSGEVKGADPDQAPSPQPVHMFPCLFCPKGTSDLPGLLVHMRSAHDFFLPEAEYVSDPIGMLSYLQEKIELGLMCLYCETQFSSGEAVRDHMHSTAHCKIRYVEESDTCEFDDFYDYSSHPSMLPAAAADGEGDAAVEGEAEGAELPPTARPDLTPAHVTESGELLLGSGKLLGHRSLRSVYQQNFRGEDERESVQTAMVQRMLVDYEAAGIPTATATAMIAARRAAHTRNGRSHALMVADPIVRKAMTTRARKAQHTAVSHQRRQLLNLGVKSNKLFVTRLDVMY